MSSSVHPPEASPASDGSSLASILAQLRVRKTIPGGVTLANMKIAMDSIWGNRTRSMLTGLGIFIGVASVVAVLILTQGIGASINNAILSFGANTVFVFPGSPEKTNTKQATSTPRLLSLDDANSLTNLPHVAALSPVISATADKQGTSLQVIYGNQTWSPSSIQGVTADFQTIQNWKIAEGSWFNPADDDASAPIALVGQTVVKNLFKDSGSPLGKTIRIGRELFKVGGVLQSKGATFGNDQDDVIYIPLHTAMRRLQNTTNVTYILVQADSDQNINQVQQSVTDTLEQRHGIPYGGQDDFQTQTSQQFLDQAGQATAIFTALFGGIAALSLTVGGIGIMNIMLVSVTERTREIGIRIALGARRSDIRNQFLVEALALCLVSGGIGLVLGLLFGIALIKGVGPSIAGGQDVPLVLSPTMLIMPFAVSAIVGIVFGLYPAIRAARLDPIEALRADE